MAAVVVVTDLEAVSQGAHAASVEGSFQKTVQALEKFYHVKRSDFFFSPYVPINHIWIS